MWGLLAARPSLAASEFLYCHNLVAGVVHWHLMKVYGLPLSFGSWFTHKPPLVLEISVCGTLVFTPLPSNRPDIVLFDYLRKKMYFIEISCPADINVPTKEYEKLHKYKQLAHDFFLMYNMSVELVPVVLGCTGVVSGDCYTHLRCIPGFTNSLFTTIQKAVLCGSVHVLQTINV